MESPTWNFRRGDSKGVHLKHYWEEDGCPMIVLAVLEFNLEWRELPVRFAQ